MVKTISSNVTKLRQKRLKVNELYSKEEFELLDTIYSDGMPIQRNLQEVKIEDFLPEGKDEYLSIQGQKSNMISKIGWFICGVLLSSAIWLIYFQVSLNEIRTKSDTQIVFHKTAELTTDKTLDKELGKQLSRAKAGFFKTLFHRSKKIEKQTEVTQLPEQVEQQNEEKTTIPETVTTPSESSPVATVRHHTIASGDSLWIIANKYYSNPSPANIDKIMKANNMRRVGILSVGQKIVVPE